MYLCIGFFKVIIRWFLNGPDNDVSHASGFFLCGGFAGVVEDDDDYGFRLARDDEELEEIPDEEVPLAAVPQTGDASVYFAILSALSGTGLAGLALTKKRDEE